MVKDKMNKLLEKIKLHQDSFFLVAVIIMVGLISFGLGRLSAKYQTAELNINSTLVNTADLNKIVTGPASETKNKVAEKENMQLPVPNGEVAAASNEVKKVVGNKNSKIYHYEDCPGALKMKEENKMFFASVLEAKNAGFRPAGNCQGLE